MSAKPEGVYKNLRLMHSCTALVGSIVHLQTTDGDVWEGIFHSFSPTFDICLMLAVKIDPKLKNSKDYLHTALKAGNKAEEQSIFELKNIVRITAADFDLNSITKDTTTNVKQQLATDADISGFDPAKSGKEKELECWQDDEGDQTTTGTMLSLEESASSNNDKSNSQNNSSGWDAKEMFSYNERVYNVKTTYDDKLSEYTLPLSQHSGKDWRDKQDRAVAIAKEIEGNTKSQTRLAKEADDGNGEEEKFSAVVRPIQQQPPPHMEPQNNRNQRQLTNRYMKRDRKAIESLKSFQKQLHITPSQPPHMSHGPHHMSHGPQHMSHGPPHSQHQGHHQPPTHIPVQAPSSQAHTNASSNVSGSQNATTPVSIPTTKSSAPSMPTEPKVITSPSKISEAPVSTPPNVTSATSKNTAESQTATTPNKSNEPQTPSSSSTTTSTSASTTTPTTTNQSELARKSKLNPNAKEFVYKPQSRPPPAQINATTPSPPRYYQQVPMFPVQQHFQNQIHYMSPVTTPHFAQQMPRGYIRGNIQNFHHRPEFSQAPMMAPANAGQTFVPQPSSGPHPMNAYAPSPQQQVIYGAPPQAMYPVMQPGYPQHMPHVMTSPGPYDGSTVYMPTQNYIVNP